MLHERFGVSPASLEWELLSQSEEGAVILMRRPSPSTSTTSATRSRARLRPARVRHRCLEGRPDLLAEISGSLTPELQYVALDADRHLVSPPTGEATSTGRWRPWPATPTSPNGFDDVVEASGEPLSAAVY